MKCFMLDDVAMKFICEQQLLLNLLRFFLVSISIFLSLDFKKKNFIFSNSFQVPLIFSI